MLANSRTVFSFAFSLTRTKTLYSNPPNLDDSDQVRSPIWSALISSSPSIPLCQFDSHLSDGFEFVAESDAALFVFRFLLCRVRETLCLAMDVDLEAPSGPRLGNGAASVTGETLIVKSRDKGEKEAGGCNGEKLGGGEVGEVELRGDRAGDETLVFQAGVGDVEGVESGVAAISDVVDKKWTRGVDDDELEDVDVDIDDSGDSQTAVTAQCGDVSVGVGGDDVGNGSEAAEDADKMENEDAMTAEGVGSIASFCENTSDNVARMEQVRVDQDGAVGEPVSGGAVGEPVSGGAHSSPHPDGRTVGNFVGESEDEEVDIGDHEPNLFGSPNAVTEENIRSEHTGSVLPASYQLPAGKEGTFSVSDMVWGKVRSHPWWPGQIFDPSKASEIAMKHHKKDCYLVAFFGDRTFAWSEASQLKHFHAHFSHVEKHGNSEALHHAIGCALEEVSRRVELGLVCQCIQSDVYEKLRYQNVESTGIQEEASRIESTDESASAYLFEPCKLLQYIKSVAQDPSNGADQLEIAIAKAQLLAFYRLKGYYHLPDYQFNELSLNSNSETVTDSTFAEGHGHCDSSLKRKHNVRDIVYTSKRERSMDESMLLLGEDYEDDENFHSSSASLLSSKRQNTGCAPKQSFRIGDCIVRAASQLTGSPGPSSFLKSISEKYQKASESNGASRDVHAQHEDPSLNSFSSAADDMFSQPQSAAHDPAKELSADSIRNTPLSPDRAIDGRNTKAPKSIKGSPEAFEFEDMKDSYWTDRVIQNGGGEKPERKLNYQVVTLQPPASLSRTPRAHSRKRYSNGDHKFAAEQPMSAIDKSKQDMLPAELILNFPDVNSIPSEGKLNNMFRRFGPLKEFETEVDRESNRARVVFKRASDAEIAYSSCEKFNIFGSSVVCYELSYTPSVSYKAARIPATQGMETVSLPELDFASSTHDIEFITMQELEDATMQDLQYPHSHDLEGVTMQDLDFTTTHDLEFPGSHDLDIVSTHASEITSIQTLDVPAQDQHLAVSEMPSSGDLEFKAGENMTDGSGAAPQDMEIATVEDQQEGNLDPSVKIPKDLEPEEVQETEAFAVEQVVNPETAGGPNSVDTTGPVDNEVSAQDADNSHGQDTEVTDTQDVDAMPIGDEKLAKDHDSVSGELLIQDKGSTDNCINSDVTGFKEPEVGTDDLMILSNQGAEQEAKMENETTLSNQSADGETNQENDSVDIQENQVALREDDKVEVEMLAPDVEKKQPDPVELDATEDLVSVTKKDAACETENTEITAREITNTCDDASVIAEDSKVETTEHDEEQVAPDFAKEAPDAELTHDDNVEIIEPPELEPQAEDSSVAGSVDAEGVTSVRNDVDDGVAIEADEKDSRAQDSTKGEEKVMDSTTTE